MKGDDMQCDSTLDIYFREFNSTIKNHEKIYLKGSIPEKKLNAAIKAYAKNVKPHEVLLLYDDTVWGSAKEGMLLTVTHLYLHELSEKPKCLKISELSSLRSKGTKLFLGKNHLLKAYQIDAKDTEVFVKLIHKLIQLDTKKEELENQPKLCPTCKQELRYVQKKSEKTGDLFCVQCNNIFPTEKTSNLTELQDSCTALDAIMCCYGQNMLYNEKENNDQKILDRAKADLSAAHPNQKLRWALESRFFGQTYYSFIFTNIGLYWKHRKDTSEDFKQHYLTYQDIKDCKLQATKKTLILNSYVINDLSVEHAEALENVLASIIEYFKAPNIFSLPEMFWQIKYDNHVRAYTSRDNIAQELKKGFFKRKIGGLSEYRIRHIDENYNLDETPPEWTYVNNEFIQTFDNYGIKTGFLYSCAYRSALLISYFGFICAVVIFLVHAIFFADRGDPKINYVKNGIYKNEHLGLSLALPPNATYATVCEEFDQFIRDKNYDLLKILDATETRLLLALSTAGNKLRDRCIISCVQLDEIDQDGQNISSSLARRVMQLTDREDNTQGELTIDSKPFFYVTSQINNQYCTQICCIIGDYLIIFNINASEKAVADNYFSMIKNADISNDSDSARKIGAARAWWCIKGANKSQKTVASAEKKRDTSDSEPLTPAEIGWKFGALVGAIFGTAIMFKIHPVLGIITAIVAILKIVPILCS